MFAVDAVAVTHLTVTLEFVIIRVFLLFLALAVLVPYFVFKKSDNEVNTNAAVILEVSS